jgi:quercetin dioxygenase-like cupin family protein
MSKETFYESLMRRQAETYSYKGKLILRAEEIKWHVSPQGRNAAIVDQTTGLEAKCFGMVISEIPPGGQSGLHQHTFEAVAYVLDGRGREIIGDQTIEWKTGDTYYMPANVPHRHINADPNKPARLMLIESWPLAIYLGTSKLEQIEPARLGPDVAE